MAFIQRNHLVRLRFVDNDGAESTCDLNLAPSVDLDTALAFADQWRVLVAALSSAVCVTCDVIVRWSETNPSPPPSDVARAGVFTFYTVNIPKDRFVFTVPAITASVSEPEGPYAGVAIDPENPAVTALVDQLIGENGISSVAPWQFWDSSDIGGGGGGWGSGGGGGGGWGSGGGGGGPWEIGSGGGGGFTPIHAEYWQGAAALLLELRTAYVGYQV